MTYDKHIAKWSAYGLVLLLIYIIQFNALGYISFYGATPLLFPLCPIILGYFEGQMAGVCCGLVTGILCDAAFVEASGQWTLFLSLMGLLVGAASRYGLHQSLLGALISILTTLFLVALYRIASFALTGFSNLALVAEVALCELGWSLLLAIPLYLIYRWVYMRVPKYTVL